jgi:hypothetical protein
MADIDRKALGILSPATADKFLDMVIANAPILQMCTCPKVDLPVGTYPVVTVAPYKTRSFTTAHTSAGRQGVASLQDLSAADISYSVKELVLALKIADSYAEDMGTSTESIAEMFAKMFAKDLHEVIINGDTSLTPATQGSPTDQESVKLMLDGLLTQLKGFTVPKTVMYGQNDNTVMKKILTLVNGCPNDYLVNPNSKIYISPSDMNTLWDESTTTKPIIKERDGKLFFRGKFELVEIANLGTNSILFGDMTGLLVPLVREVYLEKQRYPEARGWKAVLSVRADVKVHPYINMRLGIPYTAPAGLDDGEDK